MEKLPLIINTELLLKEVGKRAVLWDINNEQYKDREVREEIWHEITKILFSNYDELCVSEKENAVRAVQKRWKSCRDHYVQIQVSKKPYVYGSLMKFLDSLYNFDEIKEARTKAVKRKSDTIVIRTSRIAPNEPPSKVERSPIKKRPPSKIFRDPLVSSSKATPVSTSSSYPTAPKTMEEKMLKIWKFTNEMANDEDLSFFYSLLPTVRQLDFRQKLVFKRRTMELLEEQLYSEPVAFESKPIDVYFTPPDQEPSSPSPREIFVSTSPNSLSDESE